MFHFEPNLVLYESKYMKLKINTTFNSITIIVIDILVVIWLDHSILNTRKSYSRRETHKENSFTRTHR